MHDNHLTNRGTTTALADYAHHLTKLGHEITIGYKNSMDLNDARVISTLASKYDLRPYDQFFQIDPSEQKSFDLAYFIKSGINDDIWFTNSRSVIHSVFQYFDPHGCKYAYVSEWLANKVKKKAFMQGMIQRDASKIQNSFKPKAWVPHMISLPTHEQNLRDELGIPTDALVGLRYGGFDTFDLEFVQNSVRSELIQNPNFWFISVNTKEFYQHPRLLNLPGFFDQSFKLALLNTADFFLHGRSNGESFGLSILEAMYSKTPVLSWRGGTDKNHLTLLPLNSTYRNEKELISKIKMIKEYPHIISNYQTACMYTQNKVMRKFVAEFIEFF